MHKKLEAPKKDSNSKPAPILRYKDAEISFNKETNDYTVKTPERAKVGVKCPTDEQGYQEDDNFGCRGIGSPIANLFKKEKSNK